MPLLRGPDDTRENDGPEHGRDTAIYQELLPVAAAFDKWLAANQNEFWCPEDKEKADTIERLFDELKESLNTPL